MRGLLTILACLVSSAAAFAQAPDFVMPDIPKLHVAYEPAEVLDRGGYVQGQILLKVQVASKHAFEKLHLDRPEIEGAEVVEVVRPRTRRVRSYVGEGFVFQTAYAVFPERSGKLEIPSFSVSGAVEPEPGEEVFFTDRSAAQSLKIAGIPASYGDPWWLVSKRVRLSEAWSKPLEDLRVGDIVRREIAAVAFGVGAAQLPELEPGRVLGLSVVEAGGTAKTERAPDGLVATVKRAWDYKVDSDEVAYISPVGITYWHPEERAEKIAALPGRRIEPLPPDRAALAAALLSEARDNHETKQGLAIALLTLVALPLFLTGCAVLFLAWPTAADRRMAKACAQAATGAEVYRAIADWRVASGVSLRTISPDTPASYQDLLREVYAASDVRAERSILTGDLNRLSRRMRFRRAKAMLDRFSAAVFGQRLTFEASQR